MRLVSVTVEDTQVWEGRLMSFGERIRKIRNEQGLTAKDLSVASGIPEKTIYRIETGEVSDPKLSTIEPLVKALNCSADELLFSAREFTKLGHLRQIFLKFADLHEGQQEFMVEVTQKLMLALSFENQMGEAMKTAIRMPLSEK